MAQPTIPDIVTPLIEEFARSDMRELHIRSGDFELHLSNDATLCTSVNKGRPIRSKTTAVTAASNSPEPTGAIKPAAPVSVEMASLPAGAIIIAAPNLGTFYRAPKPGAANYVEIGSKVAVGDELCLIEVMKLFTALRSEASGTVHAILVEDGTMVTAGQPLFAMMAG